MGKVAAGLLVAAALVIAAGPAAAACSANHRIDGSTADQARKKMEAAGYSHVQSLNKGCDNYWHGTAMRNGQMVYVVLTPQGEVMREETGGTM
jgi:hypothetical protein